MLLFCLPAAFCLLSLQNKSLWRTSCARLAASLTGNVDFYNFLSKGYWKVFNSASIKTPTSSIKRWSGGGGPQVTSTRSAQSAQQPEDIRLRHLQQKHSFLQCTSELLSFWLLTQRGSKQTLVRPAELQLSAHTNFNQTQFVCGIQVLPSCCFTENFPSCEM